MTATPIIPANQFPKVFAVPFSDLTQRMDNSASGQPNYIGEAPAGSGTVEPVWRIRKMEYDDGNFKPPTAEVWANGNSNFDKVWNNRVTYTYK